MQTMSLNYIIRKRDKGYKFTKSQEKINQRMYMDDIKLFTKNVKKLQTLIKTTRIDSQDTGIEFGHVDKEKREKINDGKNRTTKSEKNQRKGKLQVLVYIESRHNKTSGDDRKKNKKRVPQTNEKTSRNHKSAAEISSKG